MSCANGQHHASDEPRADRVAVPGRRRVRRQQSHLRRYHPDPTPTVTLSASPTTVSSGGKSLLTWSSTNATSCTASGAWSGAEATSGSQSTSALTANSSYTLTCAGAGGNAAQSATVTVNAPAVSNVLSVVVDGGPAGLAGPSVNTLYTTVTVCVPGSTTQCQTIDNVQVDTQSYGLRILASVLTISLPVVAASDGNSLVECTQFVDGYSWDRWRRRTCR